jgi:SAM-dependent methyltransferase
MGWFFRHVRFAAGAFVADKLLTAFPALSRKVPPSDLLNISGSSGRYVSSGEGVVDNLVARGLRSGHNVLEIGIGIGGNATAIWRRFGHGVQFRGFDIIRFAVTWCRQHFKSLSSNYQFDHADLFNFDYNRFGKLEAAKYPFPYPKAWADIAFANSVFTHMQATEVSHYFREAARVVKPGGLIWFTFFLLDVESEAQIAAGKAVYSFKHPRGVARVEDIAAPDAAVAYPEHWIKSELAAAGFKIREIEHSSWRGRPASNYQDVVIAVRR